jgi:signal peptidase I
MSISSKRRDDAPGLCILSTIEMTDSRHIVEDVPLWQRLLIGRRPVVTLIRALILALLLLAVGRYWLLPVRITGISMEPTCHNGRLNLVNLLAFKRHSPVRGDIVCIRAPGGNAALPAVPENKHGTLYLKRVIGLPGETVSIQNGTVNINGVPLPEPYVTHKQPWRMREVTLGDDEYLVIGDNRGMAMEQHYFGRVYRDQIMGKALW